MSMLVDDIATAFSATGPLAKAIAGFCQRAEQITLAQSVKDAMLEKSSLVAEAGTGTGKTFAYLVPALLSDEKIIISTGTKALQDQLFFGDLPRLKKALGISAQSALLKGRANYLCLHRIAQNAEQGAFDSMTLADTFQTVRRKVPQLTRGEVSELEDIEENSPIWPYVTSTVDNCLGSDCGFYEDCFLVKARKKAMAAKVLVINHHLFFADSQLKEEGFTELLPDVKTVIFDEAHQLASVATHFFGERLSSRQLITLAHDIIKAVADEAADQSLTVNTLCDALTDSSAAFRLTLSNDSLRQPWHTVATKPEVKAALEQLQLALTDVLRTLSPLAERAKSIRLCEERATLASDLLTELQAPELSHTVLWFETFSRSFIIHATPLSIAAPFRECLQDDTAYIFTSATLSVDKQFTHFCYQLGLESPRLLQLDSPFNYSSQAMLYLPRGLPNPSDDTYISRLLGRACPLIDALGGRSLLLFTSYRALNLAVDWLKTHSQLTLLVQGEKSKQALLDTFKSGGNCVLLATSSFWEGVDIKGDALSLVVIDKLPFESPFEPVAQARINQLKRQGKMPFFDYQLPLAVIALKQGVGRLIRGESDFGVMMIGDPRLYGRAYGEQFFKSLPAMRLTRSEDSAIGFINAHNKTKAVVE